MTNAPVLSVADFVAIVNQTFDIAFPYVEVVGEVSNFRVSKNKWVYFDLKDEAATLKCFAVIYALSGPLEDGMVVRVGGNPKLHPQYNFTFMAQSIVAVGEGAIKRQADLLMRKLQAEGLFDDVRKRAVPKAPNRIALITAGQSAAYADFIKITKSRWVGVEIVHFDVLVQGEKSAAQIVAALEAVARLSDLPDVVVLTRGGGSAEDLAVFNDERVVRAVASSRVPTLVAIGHEIDESLAELAADKRASTPSNAAELLYPDKTEAKKLLGLQKDQLNRSLRTFIVHKRQALKVFQQSSDRLLLQKLSDIQQKIASNKRLLVGYDPRRPLEMGYALVKKNDSLIRSVFEVEVGADIEVEFKDGFVFGRVGKITDRES